MNSNCSYSLETINLDRNLWFFLVHVTLKFDSWPWKTIGHLFYATLSFVHHFIAISGFKLQIQSRKAHLGQNLQFFVSCGLEIWRMTSKNNRVPLLFHCKLCASFRSHMWIQARVYTPEMPKLGQNLFSSLLPWPLTSDLLHGHHFCEW